MNYEELPWLITPLQRLLADVDRMPHALLIAGARGVGTAEFAWEVANALLCERRQPDGRACKHCDACGWFAQSNHPDVRRLSPQQADEGGDTKAAPSKEIKVEQVRELADFIGIGAHRAGARVVLVDPADALNTVASNALLKTLEEPTAHVHFLLVADRPELLAATIRSRTVRVQLPSPSPDAAIAWLMARAGVDVRQATEWLALAAGAPLQALAFTEPDRAAAYRLMVETLARLPDTSPMAVAEALAPLPVMDWLTVLQTWVTDLGRVAAGGTATRHVGQSARLAELSRRATLGSATRFGRWLISQRGIAEHPLNARLLCEDVLIRYCNIFEGRT